jgi:hypothetical protein
MELKQSIALLFNFVAYIVIIAGVLLLLAGAWAIAAVCILGGLVLDKHLKRWCLGCHYDSMENVSIQILPIQKGDSDDIIDIEWEEITGEKE